MNCAEVSSAIPEYLTGEIDPPRRERMNEHQAGCAACRTEIEDLCAVWSRLRVLEDERPSPALRARFYAMLEEEPRASEGVPRRGPARPFWPGRPIPFLAAAAAAVVLLLLGLVIGRWSAPVRYLPIAEATPPLAGSLAAMGPPSAGERLQTVTLARPVEPPDDTLVKALLHALDNDPNVNVRLQAAESLFLFASQATVRERLTESLGRQSSPLVQIALIDILVASREKRAAEALAGLIKDRQVRPEVREHAASGLKRIL